MRKHNFSSGPAQLPLSVLQEMEVAVHSYKGSGISILEMSHRSVQFKEILDETRSLLREQLGLSDDFEILLLHGGASSQFNMIPFNLLRENGRAGFIDTGRWSEKAMREAANFGRAELLASSKEVRYTKLPRIAEIDASYDYVHITTNNTIYGTQFAHLPESQSPIVADMTSDILSRSFNYGHLDLFYASAQKNLGCTGITLVAFKTGVLGKVDRKIPEMLDYKVHLSMDSIYNTMPAASVYCCLLMLRWLQKEGGVEAIEERNILKAKLLYDELDRNALFECKVEGGDRSKMNVCFSCLEGREKAFLSYCEQRKIMGLEGHRTVGGLRASIYNAMPLSSVEHLVETLVLFEARGQ